jgi:hypothetical protein
MKFVQKAAPVLVVLFLHSSMALADNSIHNQKRIVLYFDINQTIIAGGVVEKRDFEQTIAGIFAKDIVAAWDGAKQQSYWEYLQDQIAEDMPTISRAGSLFKKERKKRLLDFPQKLKTRYPDLYKRYQHERRIMLTTLSEAHGDSVESAIFPSFFKLISWLEESGYSYAINLRSFGKDLPFIVPVIEDNSPLRFKGYGTFVGRTLNIVGRSPDSSEIKSYKTPAEIYNLFTQPPLASYAIEDSAEYWKAYCHQSAGGKLFPIDLQDPNILTMFFDDIVSEVDRGVLYPVKPNGDPENVKRLTELGYIVHANTKEAILDSNYYINKVKERLLASVTSSKPYKKIQRTVRRRRALH